MTAAGEDKSKRWTCLQQIMGIQVYANGSIAGVNSHDQLFSLVAGAGELSKKQSVTKANKVSPTSRHRSRAAPTAPCHLASPTR